MITENLAFVVPLYNESLVFQNLVDRLNKIMDDSKFSIKVIMVDDGSTDDTAERMKLISLNDKRYDSVFLSRNYGHQIALSAGLREVKAIEAAMIIDGDLQDPPELVFEFYKQLKLGYDVVYAVRKKRKEGIFKRFAYYLFYRILKKISIIDMPLDSGDFCLLSRRAVDSLNSMPEESRYLRGMRSWVGFKQIGIEYERQERVAGKSKYSLSMLIRLALNGIFNFSDYPIKFIQRTGFLSILMAVVYLIIIVFKKLFFGTVPEGFTSLLFVIIFFAGIQLLAIGVIGEYIVRIFFQVKNRPLYILKEKIVDCKILNKQIN
jgi:glycosyltransferase involved in cell wall biosynthesis